MFSPRSESSRPCSSFFLRCCCCCFLLLLVRNYYTFHFPSFVVAIVVVSSFKRGQPDWQWTRRKRRKNPTVFSFIVHVLFKFRFPYRVRRWLLVPHVDAFCYLCPGLFAFRACSFASFHSSAGCVQPLCSSHCTTIQYYVIEFFTFGEPCRFWMMRC